MNTIERKLKFLDFLSEVISEATDNESDLLDVAKAEILFSDFEGFEEERKEYLKLISGKKKYNSFRDVVEDMYPEPKPKKVRQGSGKAAFLDFLSEVISEATDNESDLLDVAKAEILFSDFEGFEEERKEYLKLISGKKKYNSFRDVVEDMYPEPKPKKVRQGSGKAAFLDFLSEIASDAVVNESDLLDAAKAEILFSDFEGFEEERKEYLKLISGKKKYNSFRDVVEDMYPPVIPPVIPPVKENTYTKFERARIVGARSLQISFGAPVLVEYPEDMLDPIDIAMLEFKSDVIPISVIRN